MVVHRTSVFRFVLGALAALAIITSESRAGLIYSYNASLGTLPQAQGWTLFQDNPNYPSPTVVGGSLHQFPYTPEAAQFWVQRSVPLDFSTTSYSYELNLHIISSNYVTNGASQRLGYYMYVSDQAGRNFFVGIASNGITINTDSNEAPNNGVPFTPFNTTDGFHVYRLTIGQGVGSLFIDGVLFASTPLGSNAFLGPNDINRVAFGDFSGVGVSESELRFANFSTPTTAAPEPTTLTSLVIGVGVLAGFARRRGKRSPQD
jgi:hypothetical protein